MRIHSIVLMLAVALGPACFAQTSPATGASSTAATRPLAFEVASIHPHQGLLRTIMGYTASGPRLRLEGDNLRNLVMEAYALKYTQVDIPDSIAHSDIYYDVLANAPEGTSPTRDDFRHMLQTLLADRFQLKAHFETKEFPAYNLVIAKGGSKLTETSPDKLTTPLGKPASCLFVRSRPGDLSLAGCSVGSLGNAIGDFNNRMVVNKTGLTGRYTMELHWTPDNIPADSPLAGGPSIFTAVEEQLGLKLVPSTASLDVLVIDSAQKPTPN